MIKKILALAGSALLCLSLSACATTGEQLPTLALPETQTSSGVESGTETAAPDPVPQDDYEDNLDGLCQYMEANYIVTGDPVEMAYETIGASDGFRYRFKYNGVTLQVEFYEFDLNNLNEKGQACLDSVKETGKFTMLDNQVPATLSDNGKYLMIYTDANDSEENKAQQERAQELFTGFYA